MSGSSIFDFVSSQAAINHKLRDLDEGLLAGESPAAVLGESEAAQAAAGKWSKVRRAAFDVTSPVPDSLGYPAPEDPSEWASDSLILSLAKAETPPTNRGSEITKGETSFSVHWLNLTVFAPINDVVERVIGLLPAGSPFDEVSDWFSDAGAVKGFGRRLVGPDGITLMGDPSSASQSYTCIRLPGSALESLGGEVFAHRVLASVCEWGWRWHVTRIDAAFDGSDVTPRRFRRAILKGQIRSRTHYTRPGQERSDDQKSSGWSFMENGFGSTCNFGNRGRGLVRVYDRRGFNRVEFQADGNHGQFLGTVLAKAPLDQWAAVCLSCLRHFVDVVDRSSDSNISRCKLVGWWAEFVQGVESAKVSFRRVVKKIAESSLNKVVEVGWKVGRIARQMAKLPAGALDVIMSCVTDAKQKLDDRQRALVREFERAGEVVASAIGIQPALASTVFCPGADLWARMFD